MSLPHNPQTDELFRSILLLRDLDDCYRYFEDLCTVKEIQAFSQRLEVVPKLCSPLVEGSKCQYPADTNQSNRWSPTFNLQV